MEREARGMARLGLSFDLILTSPVLRAAQTARIVAEALEGDGAVETVDELGCGCRLAALMEILKGRKVAGGILVVGHQPDLGKISGDLIGLRGPLGFGRGTLACIESAAWPPAPPCALIFLLPGDALEKIG
jgi:phosphohistidine phosphatase